MSDRNEVNDRDRDQQARDEEVSSNWDEVVASMDAIDEEYREEGCSTILIHPGNVATLGDRDVDLEFDILVSSDEFDDLQQWLAEGMRPSEFEVYKNSDSGVMYAVVAAVDPDSSRAIIFPVHYDHTERSSLMASAEEAGVVRVEFRPLSGDGVQLTLDPDGFFQMPAEE